MKATGIAAGVFLLHAMSAAVVVADAVKIGGFWIEGVTVLGIDGPNLSYVAGNGSEVVQPVTKIQAMRLTAHPELAQAALAIEAGQDGDAIGPLQTVLRNTRQKWVKTYVGYVLASAADRAGNPVVAVEATLTMARLQLDPALWAEAPLASVAAASAPEKQKIAKALRDALPQIKAEHRPALDKLRAAAASAPAAPAEAPGPAPIAEAVAAPLVSAGAAGRTGTASASGVILPTGVGHGSAVDLINAGEFVQAVQELTTALEQPGKLSEKLYLRGMAQLAQAEKTGQVRGYKDAGLSFMRVAIYFPRSRSVGPALLEAGYVHAKLERTELARELYRRAASHLDPEQDPEYHRRYRQLIGALD